MSAIPDGLKKYEPIAKPLPQIIINELPIIKWKIDKKHLSELREPMIVLLCKYVGEKAADDYGQVQYLTIVKFDNACCDDINSPVVDEAEWFYVLDSYPIRDKETEDIIFQKFSLKSNFKLKYPVANPFPY